MRTWSVAFLLGIVTVLQLDALPPLWVALVLGLAALGITFLTPSPYRCFGGLCFGLFWAMVHAGLILAHELMPDIEGEFIIAEGRIVSLPEQRDRGVRFEFTVLKFHDNKGQDYKNPGRIRLTWYEQVPELVPGQVWQLPVKLKRPHGFMNPGGFDYEGWLFQHRIRATGYVVHHSPAIRLAGIQGEWIDRLRYELRKRVLEILQNNHYAGLVLALSIGDRSLITPQANEVMIRTGTTHLLAISGLHISLVSGLVYFVFLRLWALAGRLPLYVPAPRAAVFAAILAATGYSFLAGMSIPTQRSMIMVVVVMLGILGHRQFPVSNVLCAALLAVLLVDPFSVMDAGFWLSFTAVAVIVYGMSSRTGTNSFWWKWGRTQYLVAIGLLPPLMCLFGQFSVSGMLANFVAIPWVSFITVPLAIVGTISSDLFSTAASHSLKLAAMSLAGLWPLLEWLSRPDFAVWPHASPSLFTVLMAMVGSLIILLPRGCPARWLGLFWMLPLLLPRLERPEPNEVWFTLLDVGQGLAAVVRTRQHTLVYDTGAKFSEHFNTGEAVVVPYLRRQQTDNIDALVISHADNDHIGGAEAVLAAWPDTPVITSVPERFSDNRARFCRSGQSWHWDGVEFSFLHPADLGPAQDNNLSCVLKVSTGEHSILLSGDIEKQAEFYLLRHAAGNLAADVLIAPHHGSKTSSTPEFINAVNPEWVLFPVGYRNRFRFPNEAIIARYESRGVRMLDTARHGAIEIRIDAGGMTVTRHRQQARRFWHTHIN